MSKPSVEVFDFTGHKSFRRNSVTIAEAITAKIDRNKVEIENLLNHIAEEVGEVSDAVVCMVAFARGTNLSPKLISVRNAVELVASLQKDNEELSLTVRNMHISSNTFYDLSFNELGKYGL